MEGKRIVLSQWLGSLPNPPRSLDLGVSAVAAGPRAHWIKDEVQDVQAQPYLKFQPVLKRSAES